MGFPPHSLSASKLAALRAAEREGAPFLAFKDGDGDLQLRRRLEDGDMMRTARPIVLALGVGLHLGIDMTLRIGFFSAAILTAYLVFLAPAAASAAVLAARYRLRRLTAPRAEPRPA